MGSVHEGVPPLQRCNLYGGLEDQDAPAQSPTMGVQLQLQFKLCVLPVLPYLLLLFLSFKTQLSRRGA